VYQYNQAEQQRLKAADSVVVIGGGPVGVEVAAEILTDLPGVQLGPLPSAVHVCCNALKMCNDASSFRTSTA
jgi:NADH dehydrogenase FAD-containing subunit